MESTLQDQATEKDGKPAFRKPVSDASSRRYRRHSPGAGSASSSDEDDKPRRTHDYVSSKQDEAQRSYKKRNVNEADKDRDYYSRSRRGDESYKPPDRYSHGSSHSYRRHDDYSRGSRDNGIDDRNYRRSSHSSRDIRDNNSLAHTRRENTHERYRENPRISGDRHRSDSGYRNKDKDRDARQHPNDNDSGPQRRQVSSLNDSAKTLESERNRERAVRDDRREHHRDADNSKNELVSACGDFMKDGQDNSSSKRKHDDIGHKKHSDMHPQIEEHSKNGKSLSDGRERERRNVDEAERQSSKSKSTVEDESHRTKSKSNVEDESHRTNTDKASKFSTEPGVFSASQIDAAPDVGAATFAAMKAAELVNRNLVGGLSTAEQKKKLLWGNKKSTAAEESTSQWDLSLFPDRERQEKFKKLMSLRLHWCLWPIVGCERRSEVGAHIGGQRWQPPSREAEGARDGFGEAVYCRTPPKRWPHRGSWSLGHLTLSGHWLVSKMSEFCFVLYLFPRIYSYVDTKNLLALSAFNLLSTILLCIYYCKFTDVLTLRTCLNLYFVILHMECMHVDAQELLF